MPRVLARVEGLRAGFIHVAKLGMGLADDHIVHGASMIMSEGGAGLKDHLVSRGDDVPKSAAFPAPIGQRLAGRFSSRPRRATNKRAGDGCSSVDGDGATGGRQRPLRKAANFSAYSGCQRERGGRFSTISPAAQISATRSHLRMPTSMRSRMRSCIFSTIRAARRI